MIPFKGQLLVTLKMQLIFLTGKTRDRYKEAKYPENMEKIVICNTSPLEADVSFCFQQDSTAATFIIDPPSMKLKPGESQVGWHINHFLNELSWCSFLSSLASIFI